jgi:hypothetical protein
MIPADPDGHRPAFRDLPIRDAHSPALRIGTIALIIAQ